jgi:hypothetical protein
MAQNQASKRTEAKARRLAWTCSVSGRNPKAASHEVRCEAGAWPSSAVIGFQFGCAKRWDALAHIKRPTFRGNAICPSWPLA